MKISDSCISAAKEALDVFTEVDLKRYVEEVFGRARTYDDLTGQPQAAIERAIKEVGDENAQVYMEDMQRKVNDESKLDRFAKPIKEGKASLLNTLVRRVRNSSDNVQSAIASSRKKLMDSFFNILTSEETAFIADTRNEMLFADALDGREAPEIAKSLAKKFNETYIPNRNAEMVNSGALLLRNINKDRILRAIHDPAKLLRAGRVLTDAVKAATYSSDEAFPIWRDYIKSRLDIEATFSGTPALDINPNTLETTVNHVEVDKMLNDIFNSITQGKPYLIGEGTPQEKFFYWKDNKSWIEYNKAFGKGDLLRAIRSDIQTSASKIGMANILGSNAQAGYNALAKIEAEFNPANESIKNIALKNFNYLRGQDQVAINPDIASFFGTLRTLTGWSRLPLRMTMLSLPDIANGIMFAKRYGAGYFESYGVYLSGMFDAIPTEERKYIASLFKENVDTHAGYFARFIDQSGVSDMMNNLNNKVYHLTGMDALDRGNKISAMQMMARILGDNSSTAYEGLTRQGKLLLDKFNITPKEWDVLRTKTVALNGRKLLAIDSLDKITDSEMRQMYGEGTQPLYQLRDSLHRKVYSMFDVASENSVLTPGAFMMAATKIGQRGTILGELAASMFQFKMYGLEFMDRVLYQGWQSADGIQNKLKFGAFLMGATLPMSYLSAALDNISRGKTMPDMSKMTFGEQANYAMQLLLPGTNLLGNFMDPHNQDPNGFAKFFSTPALKLLWEGVEAPISLVEAAGSGNWNTFKKQAEKSFKAIGQSVAPGQSIPFLSPYMRQMFGDKPYSQPGQRQLFGA